MGRHREAITPFQEGLWLKAELLNRDLFGPDFAAASKSTDAVWVHYKVLAHNRVLLVGNFNKAGVRFITLELARSILRPGLNRHIAPTRLDESNLERIEEEIASKLEPMKSLNTTPEYSAAD